MQAPEAVNRQDIAQKYKTNRIHLPTCCWTFGIWMATPLHQPFPSRGEGVRQSVRPQNFRISIKVRSIGADSTWLFQFLRGVRHYAGPESSHCGEFRVGMCACVCVLLGVWNNQSTSAAGLIRTKAPSLDLGSSSKKTMENPIPRTHEHAVGNKTTPKSRSDTLAPPPGGPGLRPV